MKTLHPHQKLVETWLYLLDEGDEVALTEHGRNMLISSFGSMTNAIQSIKLNGITTEDIARTEYIDGIDLL